MSLTFEYGDIISKYCESNRNLILQQNNCTATKVSKQSFAGKLSEKLPYSNPYKDRRQGPFPNLANINDRPKPGSINLRCGNRKNDPLVCCCFGQYRMGNGSVPYYMNSPKTDITYKKTVDDPKKRFQYFSKCLSQLLTKFKKRDHLGLNRIETILVPGYIGCGLGGGDWNFYKNEITEFYASLKCIRPDINIKVVYLNHPNKHTQKNE